MVSVLAKKHRCLLVKLPGHGGTPSPTDFEFPTLAPEFEVLDTFARGPIVVNERIDRFTLPDRSIEWRGVGVFYLKDGAIAEWSDFTIAFS